MISQMRRTFYLIKWAYFYNSIILMTLDVCAQMSGSGVSATKFVFSTLTMSIFDSNKICQIRKHSDIYTDN